LLTGGLILAAGFICRAGYAISPLFSLPFTAPVLAAAWFTYGRLSPSSPQSQTSQPIRFLRFHVRHGAQKSIEILTSTFGSLFAESIQRHPDRQLLARRAGDELLNGDPLALGQGLDATPDRLGKVDGQPPPFLPSFQVLLPPPPQQLPSKTTSNCATFCSLL
jgi:hypothetical protein